MQLLPEELLSPRVIFGFVGLLLAYVVFAYVASFFKKWRGAEDAMLAPISITLKTEKTPEQVWSAARAARIKRRWALVTIGAIIWLALHLWVPERTAPFENFAVEILVAILEGLLEIMSAFNEGG